MRFLPILAAAASTMIIGGLWYSPLLFARPWMIAMGFDPDDKAKLEEMKKSSGPLYGAAFLATVITAAVLHMFAHALSIHGVVSGMQLGLWSWAGFVAPIKFTDAIFGKRGRTLLFIDSGYQLVCFLVMGAILGGWQ